MLREPFCILRGVRTEGSRQIVALFQSRVLVILFPPFGGSKLVLRERLGK